MMVDERDRVAMQAEVAPGDVMDVSSAIWAERVKAASTIGFLKGCLEGLKWDADEKMRARIDAALKSVEDWSH